MFFNGFSNSIHSTKKSPCASRRIFLWQNYCKLIQCTASSGNAPSGHGPHFAGELNFSPFLFQLSVFRCLSDSVIGMLLAKPGIFPFPDDLRHTFATLALQNGINVKTVSSMLGHSSTGFTLATYTHARNKVQEQAAAKMGNLLKQAL